MIYKNAKWVSIFVLSPFVLAHSVMPIKINLHIHTSPSTSILISRSLSLTPFALSHTHTLSFFLSPRTYAHSLFLSLSRITHALFLSPSIYSQCARSLFLPFSPFLSRCHFVRRNIDFKDVYISVT